MKNSQTNLGAVTYRNSSIELLRIIAMVFIVLSHACVHSGFDISEMGLLMNRLVVQWGNLGNLSVDIFLLITGYFYYGKKVQIETISKLLSQVWFYSIVLAIVCIWKGYDYTFYELLKVFFPTIFLEYSFFSAYLIILVFSTYINIFVDIISKQQMRNVICLCMCIWVIIPTVTTSQMFSNRVIEFFCLYLIGAFLNKYPNNVLEKRCYRVFAIICTLSSLFLSTFVIDRLSDIIYFAEGKGTILYGRNSLFVVICAVALFTCAIYRKPIYSKFINTIGSCTFGVYLIHDNPVVRHILWKQMFELVEYSEDALLVCRILGSTVIVFCLCLIIEYIRQMTVAKPFAQSINKILSYIMRRLDGIKEQ